jgi:acetate kinase
VRVLILNAGSSSLKTSVLDIPRAARRMPAMVASASVDWGSDATRIDASPGVVKAIKQFEADGLDLSTLEAVAHRVVHGGPSFVDAVVVDDRVLEQLDALAPLAPLHNPVAVATIRAARRVLPGLPHVAVFDTGFHATLPESARRYPVPQRWTEDWGVRRYGFHGLSVEWSVERAAQLLGRRASSLALVVAHLGSGCSVTAVSRGRSVATSMGMTPLEGLMMGTRAGSIDPGILLMLLREDRLTLAELAKDLDHASGLLGVAGRTGEVKELLDLAAGGNARARLALEMFVERAAAGIAAAVTALPRLDAIVFTAGIGEHAGSIRAAIVKRLAAVGVGPISAAENGKDRVVRAASKKHGAAVLRVEAREDIVAARRAAALRWPSKRGRPTQSVATTRERRCRALDGPGSLV